MFTSKIPNHSFNKKELIKELSAFLPKNGILYKEEDLSPYECDGLSAYQILPWLVVLPETIAQIQKLLQICNVNNIPIVPRGAGTGLSGGALPLSNGVLISLAKFNRILAIDPLNRTARVQPGVRNLAISEAAAPHRLYYAPDPSSQIACTIGGNVAENSGGVHCLKYGLTVHNVLALKILTITGELISLGSTTLDYPGYDLISLMTGSEGLLGIIIEITVKLLPIPEQTQLLLAAFNTVEEASKAVSTILSAGIIPAGLEMMDQLAIQAAENFVQVGYPRNVAAILLCELDGNATEVSYQFEQVKSLLSASGAAEIRIAENKQEQLKLWKGRKAAFPAVGRISPDYYCMDGTIPRKKLAEVLIQINKLSEEFKLPIANVFHAGDGNLHPLILYDGSKPGELERAEQLGAEILELCVTVGGAITGEHGVGIEKINQMCIQFSTEELQQFHEIKSAFDPNNLLNPGKGIPTLHRCAEFGATHVHHNNFAFPDLERF
ncbi:FAD-linked oxidase C-terminal domain-containing protein [Candidatus Nitrosacidococcus sp. I8]|uniref:FAD-linked oxidase C-terminal domain-containing protein n=1 Tax=Candidatus Nitrosacidococcus sp. I8 TaxID=2942908 RepID=UPI0022275C89|nr:FAD-linked oxidase C-terminal domain-containing protein [Candidatus Nitrosacidococcus sp. I8]CAH9017823.1 putative FAD-linked oxidoreductase [Candidatus Nitrosacidococcus sp. I8]